jgi:chemotaxis protein MotB
MPKIKEEIIIRQYDPNAWMVTFSDLLTLLLTFFVLLLTMSSMDEKIFRDSFGMVVSDPGVNDEGGSTDLVRPNVVPAVDQSPLIGSGNSQISTDIEAYQELLALLDTLREAEGLIDIDITEDSISIRFLADLSFAPNRADLSPAAADALSRLAPLFGRLRFPLRIEGHAADSPGGGADPRAQMSLSLLRAHAVLLQLTQEGTERVPEPLVSMLGLGAHSPAVDQSRTRSTTLPPADPRNSRVEIIVDTRIKDFTL